MITSDLSRCGLIAITGDDAKAFLHSQLTSDVNGLTLNHSQYSGYCTPKGRLLASFLLWRDEQGYFMDLPASLRESVQKRLSMYILRSKVKMHDASGEFACFGVAGEQAAANLKQVFSEVPCSPHEVGHRAGITVVRLPDERFLVVVPRQKAAEVHQTLSRNAKAITTRYWDWLGIRAGIPVITPATQEEFVPQMVNFDAIGAVSFNKGCYPGQEIVARMHYLGRLKQRMVLANIATDEVPQPGDKLYSASLGEQASGSIVNAVASPDGGCDALAVVQIGSLAGESIHWKSPDGPVLTLLPLPYKIDLPTATSG